MPAFLSNGPDIPERLLQAHEEGRVVFFCGAGISSYPAGLPGFYKLVSDLYKELGVTPNSIQNSAIKNGQLDTAIGLLEADIAGGRTKVRRKVKELLQIKSTSIKPYIIHESLLKLAKNRDGKTRLITTNFDRLFEHIIKEQKLEIPRFDAPLLPIPKNRLNGLVYLHGLIKTSANDNDLERLVLSSGDFGLAYLTERWAARFISELFRNFTVCFIGYSINDPVMRYMMDAYAADQLLGESAIEMFAFGNYAKGKEKQCKEMWEAKNVTPILYKNHYKHYYLRQTLINWAKTYGAGESGKKMIVATHASNPPLSSAKTDYVTGRILWALTDELAAEHFADLTPVPPLEWLEPLSEYFFSHRDLSRFNVTADKNEDKKLKFSLTHRPTPYKLATWMRLVSPESSDNRLDRVEYHIARWLIRHLNDPKVIYWLISNGGLLHDEFRFLIRRQIQMISEFESSGNQEEIDKIKEGAPCAVPNHLMRHLWRLILSNKVRSYRQTFDIYEWAESFKLYGMLPSVRIELCQLLQPYLILNKPSSFFKESDVEITPQKLSDIVAGKIAINSDHAHDALKNLNQNEAWKESSPDLLQDFSSILKDCLDLMKELGSVNEKNDLSYIHQPSITEHSQNQHFEDWTVLIELTRDAWIETGNKFPEKAKLVAESWIQIPYPLFKRLAFFAGTYSHIVPPYIALEWLISDDNWWFWTRETQREAIRLMVSLILNITDDQMKRSLEDAILQGPPREMYREDVTDEEWQQIVDEKILLRLSKIIQAGGSLSDVATSKCMELKLRYSYVNVSDDDLDEFPFRMLDNEEGIQFIYSPRSYDELIEWLKEHPDSDHRVDDDWRSRCKEDITLTSKCLADLAQQEIFPIGRWREALQEWSQEPDLLKISWEQTAPIIFLFPEKEFNELSHTFGWWIQKQAKEFNGHQDIFIKIIERLLDAEIDHRVETTESIVSNAINHPVGYATQSLLDWWYRQNLKASEGLKEDFLHLFTKICDLNSSIFVYGRILLSAHIITLFRVDERWTKTHLLPLYDWGYSKLEATAIWKGFLWSPRIYIPLLKEIKKPLLETVLHYDSLGKAKKQYTSFITYIALNSYDVFRNKEMHEIMNKLPLEGIIEVSNTLARAFEAAKDRHEYWKQFLKPFIKNIWPKSREVIHPLISEKFSRVCLFANDIFQEVFEELQPWLVPVSYPSYLISKCKESNLCKRYPLESLKFLSAIIADDCELLTEDLQICLEEIVSIDQKFKEDPIFIRLFTLYQRKRRSS